MLSMAPPPPPIRPPLSSGCNPEAEEGERIALYFLGGWEGGGVNKPEEGTASASPNKSRMLEAAPATLAGLPASDAPPFAKNSAKFVGGLFSISIKRTIIQIIDIKTDHWRFYSSGEGLTYIRKPLSFIQFWNEVSSNSDPPSLTYTAIVGGSTAEESCTTLATLC